MRGLVAAAAAAFVLAGCSGGGSKGGAAATDDPVRRAAFLDAVHERWPGGSDESALRVAAGVCSDFDEGKTWVEELALFVTPVEGSTPIPAKDAGWIIGASTTAFCPQYSNLAPKV